MKKTILLLLLICSTFYVKSNDIKVRDYFHSYETIDSVKHIIKRDNMFLNLNIDGYRDKNYLYDSIIKTKYDIGTKYETILFDFNQDEEVSLMVVFYNDGKRFIVLKNLKNREMKKYKF